MTVAAGTTKTTKDCNGSLTDFDFSFAVYKEEDLTIIVRDIEQVETLLVLGTDYTVASDNFNDGGTVSTIKEIAEELVPYAWPTGYTITIMLDIALTQETDLLYGGTFSAEAIEKCSDKLTRIAQQLDEQLRRTIKLQKSSSQENVQIEDLEAGKFIIVNADGDGLEMGEIETEPGQSFVSNIPYDKNTWNAKIDTAPSKNAVRDELANNRFTKGGTYATVLALSHGVFSALPVSNIIYSALWADIVDTAPSKKAIYDKIESIGSGAGDVVGPATNSDDYVPQWNGADSKILKEGFPITAAGKALIDDANVAAQRTTLGLGSAALRTAEDILSDGSDLPDGHAIIIYGDANWGAGSGDVVGPASATNSAIPLFDGTTGKLIKDSVRLIEDTLSDGSNIPDGHAIKIYGDANWNNNYTNLTEFLTQTAWRLFYSNADGDVTELGLGTSGQYLKATGSSSAPIWDVPGGAGDVVGPAIHAADYVPQWNETPNSKILVEGFPITAAGKALMDDANVAAQRTTLGLGSAALRTAEDILSDGSDLPDGHAIITYGNTNWGVGSSKWTDAGQYIYMNNGSGYRILEAGTDLTTVTFAANTTYVLAPGADYEIGSSVTIANSRVVIIGFGATIKKVGSAMIQILGNHCKLIGFEVNGNSQGYNNINVQGSYNEIIEVTSHHSTAHGIALDGSGSTCNYNKIVSCTAYSNSWIGIGSWKAAYNEVTGNISHNNGAEAFTCDGDGAKPAYGNIFSFNMAIGSASNSGFGIDSAHFCVFIGNYCANNNGSGFITHNIETGSSYNTISGNTFANNGRYGLELISEGGGPAVYNKIVGNTYYNNSLGTYYICGTCTNNEVIETAGGDLVGDTSPQLGGDLDGNDFNIGLTNNRGLFGKNTSGVDKELARMSTYNVCTIGAGSPVALGDDSVYPDAVGIRVGGTNQNWIQKSIDTDSQGKYFLVVA